MLSDSPLINRLSPPNCLVSVDQRGTSRPVDSWCDYGAYEYPEALPDTTPYVSPTPTATLDPSMTCVDLIGFFYMKFPPSNYLANPITLYYDDECRRVDEDSPRDVTTYGVAYAADEYAAAEICQSAFDDGNSYTAGENEYQDTVWNCEPGEAPVRPTATSTLTPTATSTATATATNTPVPNCAQLLEGHYFMLPHTNYLPVPEADLYSDSACQDSLGYALPTGSYGLAYASDGDAAAASICAANNPASSPNIAELLTL